MPGGRLMLTMGGSIYKNGNNHGTTTLVSFSDDGINFSTPEPVSLSNEVKRNYDWIWRVTWHGDTGYAVDYHTDSLNGDWEVVLLKTVNGADYQLVYPCNIPDRPSEATIRFSTPGDTMNILLRRDKNGANGLFGKSSPPYTHWQWHDLGIRLGGPNFVKLPDGSWCIGTRLYPADGNGGAKTALYHYRAGGDVQKIMELPSGGDNSYPGMVINNKILYIVYYSSHKQNTAIYFTKIKIKRLEP